MTSLLNTDTQIDTDPVHRNKHTNTFTSAHKGDTMLGATDTHLLWTCNAVLEATGNRLKDTLGQQQPRRQAALGIITIDNKQNRKILKQKSVTIIATTKIDRKFIMRIWTPQKHNTNNRQTLVSIQNPKEILRTKQKELENIW